MPFVKAETCLVALKSLSSHMLLPFWREVTFDFDSPKNHWLFSVSDDAPEAFEFTDALLEWRKVKDRIIFQKTADQEN